MMTVPSRHQDWKDFAELIRSGHPALVVVPGSPQVTFFSERNGSRVGLRVACSGTAPSLRLCDVTAASVVLDGDRYLEISTQQSRVYQEFYAFACSLADRVQVAGQPPVRAVSDSLS